MHLVRRSEGCCGVVSGMWKWLGVVRQGEG